uniref:IPT/TIG domain-containing protein n=1 Tax=Tetraselmis sp. GSL018 TaxID=582737 RepID=A0A061RH36_9CHLO
MCASPAHKGVRGNPDATTEEITQDSNENYPQFGIGLLVSLPDDPRLVSVCSPWAETNGFFFGDSVYSYHSDGVILNINDVNHDRSMLGNSIRGISDPITHTYDRPDNDGEPFIAYMTGGNRLATLNNNAHGRFRLEIGVKFLTALGSDGRPLFRKNRSPVASTIPIMPVVYTDSVGPNDGARFQIAAIDPDFGVPDLRDQVRFFIGTKDEHGGILGKPVYVPMPDGSLQEVFTWYEDYYHAFICDQRLAVSSLVTKHPADEICTSEKLVGRDRAQRYSDGLNRYEPRKGLDVLYSQWDPVEDSPRPPPDLTIDPYTGFVTFQTGKDPWTNATNGALAKAPGLWQLTVTIEERHGTDIDPENGTDIDAEGRSVPPQRGFGMKVPLDFLIYLYTPMHYCSKGCVNAAVPRGANYPEVLQTFESENGLYGDPDDPNFERSDGLLGSGTGECRLCGGGGNITDDDILGIKVMYKKEGVKNTTQFCRVPEVVAQKKIDPDFLRPGSIGSTGTTFGYEGVELDDAGIPFKWKKTGDGELVGWRFMPQPDSSACVGCIDWMDDECTNCTNKCRRSLSYSSAVNEADGWVFQGCLGYRDNETDTLLPYDGMLDSCLINTMPEFITDCTPRHPSGDCGVITEFRSISYTPALNCSYRIQNGGIVPQDSSFACCNSSFPLTPVNEQQVDASAGVYKGMYLPAVLSGLKGEKVQFDLVATDYDHCVELEILDTGLYDGMSMSVHERLDTRTVRRTFTWDPVNVDGDLVTTADEDERRELTLVCFYAFDRYLATANPFHCVRIELAMPASVRWCDQPSGTRSPLPLVTANSVLPAFLGEETCVDLCVAKRDDETTFVPTDYKLALRTIHQEVRGIYPDPNNVNFTYPYDTINFPPSGAWKGAAPMSDPHHRQWCFIPTPAEECVYTVCFQGYDNDTVVEGDYHEEHLETTNIRCVKVEVHNTVARFSGTELLETDELSKHIVPFGENAAVREGPGGLTMATWVRPSCDIGNINQTVIYFGSTRSNGGRFAGGDAGLEVRNAIMYHRLDSGASLGYFSYRDCKIGNVYSTQRFCCQRWHYVAVTIDSAGHGFLYVDGTRPGHGRLHSRDEVIYDEVPFNTTSFPDNNADGDRSGIFTIGGIRDGNTSEFFQGEIDEVRVWNRALGNSEVLASMYDRVPDPSDPTLKAHFSMRERQTPGRNPVKTVLHPEDMSGTLTMALVSINGNSPNFEQQPIPPMIPCVLGLQHVVGPVDGGCLVDVYGWSMADSVNVVCQFGGEDSPGSFRQFTRMRCITPGHISPRFAVVKVSNDGYRFTDTTGAGREVHHLFMESSLYTDGAGSGGVSADDVCLDLPSREITFGGWFCPNCVMPKERLHPDEPEPMGEPNTTATPTPTPEPTPDETPRIIGGR